MNCEQTTKEGKTCSRPNGHLGPCAFVDTPPEPPKGKKGKWKAEPEDGDAAA